VRICVSVVLGFVRFLERGVRATRPSTLLATYSMFWSVCTVDAAATMSLRWGDVDLLTVDSGSGMDYWCRSSTVS